MSGLINKMKPNVDLGENCKYCLCNRCRCWEICGILHGNTQEYCEEDCIGEASKTKDCSDFIAKY